jgi:hypothetical protein
VVQGSASGRARRHVEGRVPGRARWLLRAIGHQAVSEAFCDRVRCSEPFRIRLPFPPRPNLQRARGEPGGRKSLAQCVSAGSLALGLRSPGTGATERRRLSFAPVPGLCAYRANPMADAMGYSLTLLRSYTRFGLTWVFNRCAVHLAGDNLLRSKHLLARRPDSGRAANCRCWGEAQKRKFA